MNLCVFLQGTVLDIKSGLATPHFVIIRRNCEGIIVDALRGFKTSFSIRYAVDISLGAWKEIITQCSIFEFISRACFKFLDVVSLSAFLHLPPRYKYSNTEQITVIDIKTPLDWHPKL